MSKSMVIDTHVDRPCPNSSWQTNQAMSMTAMQRENDSLYEEGHDDEDQDELDQEDGSTFTSSPSIPNEDINFDLVYTLHSFVATVEGQASVVKGEALTLLDDSNSYWWLVRVLNTSEVGYIPAENIEITLAEQVPFLQEKPKNPHRPPKKVVMSRNMTVQAQIILMDDDDGRAIGEAYEEWLENIMQEEEDETDEGDEEDEEDEKGSPEYETSGTIQIPVLTSATTSTSTATAPSPPPPCSIETQPVLYPTIPSDCASLHERSTPASQRHKSNTTQPTEDKRPTRVSSNLWKLFARVKKDPHPSGKRPETDTQSTSSLSSSSVSEDHPPTQCTRDPTADGPMTVLRVFAGNINVNATYHTLLVNADTSAEQLLAQALERFHISQIEHRASGRPLRTTSTSGMGGVEYYLTVKAMNGEEITLTPEDNPLAIFQSLTAHLTTPMPSLTPLRQLSQQMRPADGSIRVRLSAERRRVNKTRFGEDAVIRFYLHKRIRRVSNGQIYVKVFLSTGPNLLYDKHETMTRPAFSTRTLRRKKASDQAGQEYIEKLIAVSAAITVAELTQVALAKFHLTPHNENDQYRLTLAIPRKAGKTSLAWLGYARSECRVEKLLSPSSKVAEIVHDDNTDGARSTVDKRFILRKVRHHHHHHHHHANPTSSPWDLPRHHARVVPEKRPGKPIVKVPAAFGYRSPTPVTNLDAGTEGILRRLDAALLAFEPERRNIASAGTGTKANTALTMAVSRNTHNGVDIIMPHGILRSKPWPGQQIHCSLVAPVGSLDRTKPLKMEVVVEKAICPSTPSTKSNDGFSDADIAALVMYSTAFLEEKESKSGTGQNGSATPSLRLNNGTLDVSSGQLSSMDELEKEFQRIIAAHTV